MKPTLYLACLLIGTVVPVSTGGSLVMGEEPAGETSFLHNGVTAHRGNSAEFPENTLAAFASAVDLGADWIELDLFRSRDGKLVVVHDRTTARTGDRSLSIADSLYEDLRSVDVATDFRKRHRKTVDECPAAHMPLLEEVLQLVGRQHRTRVSLQPKVDCVAEAVAIVKKLKMEKQVGFNDGNRQFMITAKKLAPDVTIFWDRGPDTDLDADLRIAREHGFHALVLRHDGVTEEKVQKIRSAGLEAGAWTVNDPARMQALLKMGVQRLYTDDPRTLLQLKTRES